MVKTCGMKLDIMHIKSSYACPVGHGDSISTILLGIGAVKIKPSYSSGGQNRFIGDNRMNFLG